MVIPKSTKKDRIKENSDVFDFEISKADMQKLDTQVAAARSTLTAQRARVIETVRNDYESALAQERSFSASLRSAG